MKYNTITLPFCALAMTLLPLSAGAAGQTPSGTPTISYKAPVGIDSIQGSVMPISETMGTPVSNAPLRLTREECIDIALQSNPTIRVANMEIKRMDYSKREVIAGLLPKIDFSGAYQRAIELQTIRMNMGGQSQSFKMGSDNTWTAGFSAQLPLIAPALWKALDISDSQILASLESARESRLNMANQVSKAYYALLLAEASKEVVEANIEVAKLNAATFEKQFAAGTASEYDVLRSAVQVRNLEPELLQAEIAIKQCKLQLKVLMGMDIDVDITPAITLKDLQRDMYAYALNARDISNNAALRSLDIQQGLAEKNVTLKKFNCLPTLGLNYNYNWMSLSNGNPFKNQEFNPYSTLQLGLSVPIFAGGSRYYGIKQAEIQRDELKLQRENLVSSLEMQVEVALDNIRRQAEQIKSSEENVKMAAKAQEIMQKSFDIGAATYLNLRDSELANTSARLSYLQSIYNYLVSTADLDLLLGREYKSN